jgi:hypothetical protein
VSGARVVQLKPGIVRMTARSVLLACALAMLALSRPATAGMLEGAPDAIVCDFESGSLVVYAARRMQDGTTLYESLEREFTAVITVDAHGVLHWENRPDCDGKSVDQLRDEGRAFDFAR